MLKATFQCFRGIGESAECRLWESGCLCWRDFQNGAADFLSPKKQEQVRRQIDEAEIAYATRTIDWFLNRMKGVAQLRILHDFMADTVFLDIETTGLTANDSLTCVATWRNGVAKCFVNEINLKDFLYEVADARLLATYNGHRFDIPFLRRCFGIDLSTPHLDLAIPLRALGHRGGLKAVEERLGFQRRFSQGTDGAGAVRLWHAWQDRGDSNALEKLIVYNVEDAYSLPWLSARLLRYAMQNYPFNRRCNLPAPPAMSEILDKMAL